MNIKLINKLEINLHKFKTGKEITELNLFLIHERNVFYILETKTESNAGNEINGNKMTESK